MRDPSSTMHTISVWIRSPLGYDPVKPQTLAPNGWLVVEPTPLKNDGVKVNGKDDISYMKWKIEKYLKPPTIIILGTTLVINQYNMIINYYNQSTSNHISSNYINGF